MLPLFNSSESWAARYLRDHCPRVGCTPFCSHVQASSTSAASKQLGVHPAFGSQVVAQTRLTATSQDPVNRRPSPETFAWKNVPSQAAGRARSSEPNDPPDKLGGIPFRMPPACPMDAYARRDGSGPARLSSSFTADLAPTILVAWRCIMPRTISFMFSLGSRFAGTFAFAAPRPRAPLRLLTTATDRLPSSTAAACGACRTRGTPRWSRLPPGSK